MDRRISRIKVKLPGLERAAKSLLEILMYPLVYADLTKKIGIEPPKGVLLYGPPGVGKTSIVKCVVEICDAHLDSIAPQRNNSQGRESRIVAQLLTLMDGVISRGRLVIIGATNRPNSVDSAVRRPGRLDREIGIDVPTETERLQILQNLTSHLNLSPNTSLKTIASQTVGYVGADLVALIRESTLYAIANSESDEVVLTMSGFKHGLATVSPSTVRAAGSLTVSVPDLTWEDVGGYAEVKKKIKQAVEWPLTKKEKLEKLGVQSVKGILMYGPPGCSKTTLVKVVASTTKSTFLSINGASIYSPFVGDSEATIRSVFARARTSSPSIIFFDELDAIVGKRQLEGNGRAGGDSVQERVLSTLLNEMDGIESSSTILVMAATNRPDLIDAALLRPGRFDRLIYIPPPDEEARIQIMKIHTRNMPLSESVNLESLAKEMHGYTGADIQSVCTEAAFGAIRKISRNREDFAGELAEKTVVGF
ncbi:hypothetical protein HK098_006190 [Nowakowskiella sp. JEL0407]|nr:hypothetical protein HK098_006190 [Nowakowskiella sp. JEL0407]